MKGTFLVTSSNGQINNRTTCLVSSLEGSPSAQPTRTKELAPLLVFDLAKTTTQSNPTGSDRLHTAWSCVKARTLSYPEVGGRKNTETRAAMSDVGK